MDYGSIINLTIVTIFLIFLQPNPANSKAVDPSSSVSRPKRSYEGVEEYHQDNSRYMKRPQRFSFGLGKRSDGAVEETEETEELPALDDYDYIMNQLNKRAPYNFGLGKRSYKREPYAFGLGKRAPYGFGLGKREPYGFGLGKRMVLLKRQPYAFGLGKR